MASSASRVFLKYTKANLHREAIAQQPVVCTTARKDISWTMYFQDQCLEGLPFL